MLLSFSLTSSQLSQGSPPYMFPDPHFPHNCPGYNSSQIEKHLLIYKLQICEGKILSKSQMNFFASTKYWLLFHLPVKACYFGQQMKIYRTN